ncbi:NAD(P)H-dependent flavin oxidoreductase [Niallia nealsonii]|uniref:Probable nitronate monooxygenase n=1 Tax=Niallia nealsonii TaxID=115979 RepID=A0A2N0Z587_9BACI|nr:nitronate monooxygenase family protein [Niallia nealsonii]PKG24678.1 2-nitropropane dioxygenase [Niallia nealsonii]
MKTSITSLLNIKYPIIQGGLAYLGNAELAAAVSNSGGLGQITAMTLFTPQRLREEIQKVRALTDKPFGVNFAIGSYNGAYMELLETAIKERVKVISITGGNPEPILERIKGENIVSLVLVSTVRQAKKAEKLGASAVIAVGQEGGGHIGKDDIGTMVLIPRVVESISIPVIASGGVGDGRGFLAALALGAEGIEMGTRFIATVECVDAIQSYKNALVEGTEMDTVVIKRTFGTPGRVLKSDYSMNIIKREKQGDTYEELKDMVSGTSNLKYIYDGDQINGFAWAGQVIGLINDVPKVEALIDNIMKDAMKGITRLNKLL